VPHTGSGERRGVDQQEERYNLGVRRVTLILLLAATAAATSGTIGRAAATRVRCPTDVTARSVRPATVDGVIAAARRVVLDHITENNQGRITRRTPANFPVLEVVQLTGFPPLPGSASLKRLAIQRCGKTAANWAWAVVFTDTQSPVCCIREIVFVVRVERGWRVF
jgi:hypothetical protein